MKMGDAQECTWSVCCLVSFKQVFKPFWTAMKMVLWKLLLLLILLLFYYFFLSNSICEKNVCVLVLDRLLARD